MYLLNEWGKFKWDPTIGDSEQLSGIIRIPDINVQEDDEENGWLSGNLENVWRQTWSVSQYSYHLLYLEQK